MTHIDPEVRRALATEWHDTVCPEGEQCRDRSLHIASEFHGFVVTRMAQIVTRLYGVPPEDPDLPCPSVFRPSPQDPGPYPCTETGPHDIHRTVDRAGLEHIW